MALGHIQLSVERVPGTLGGTADGALRWPLIPSNAAIWKGLSFTSTSSQISAKNKGRLYICWSTSSGTDEGFEPVSKTRHFLWEHNVHRRYNKISPRATSALFVISHLFATRFQLIPSASQKNPHLYLRVYKFFVQNEHLMMIALIETCGGWRK